MASVLESEVWKDRVKREHATYANEPQSYQARSTRGAHGHLPAIPQPPPIDLHHPATTYESFFAALSHRAPAMLPDPAPGTERYSWPSDDCPTCHRTTGYAQSTPHPHRPPRGYGYAHTDRTHTASTHTPITHYTPAMRQLLAYKEPFPLAWSDEYAERGVMQTTPLSLTDRRKKQIREELARTLPVDRRRKGGRGHPG